METRKCNYVVEFLNINVLKLEFLASNCSYRRMIVVLYNLGYYI